MREICKRKVKRTTSSVTAKLALPPCKKRLKAARAAKINKHVKVNTFHHSFATHLLKGDFYILTVPASERHVQISVGYACIYLTYTIGLQVTGFLPAEAILISKHNLSKIVLFDGHNTWGVQLGKLGREAASVFVP